MLGTREAVAMLTRDGFHVSKSRLDGLIASGRITSPGVIGTSRVWTDTDIQAVRDALVRLDGPPRAMRAALLDAAKGGRRGTPLVRRP